MVQRHFNISRGTLFFAFLIVGVMLLLIPDRYTGRLNESFLLFFDPVLSIGPKIPDFLPGPGTSSEDSVDQQKYDELWKEYKNQGEELVKLKKDYQELAKIRKGVPGLADSGLIPATVVKKSISGHGHELIIRKGSNGDVEVGQYVLAPNISNPVKSSIIGTVSEVRNLTSTVRLVTDAKQNMLVYIRRGDEPASAQWTLVGDGKGACKIPQCPTDTSVKAGDTVFAAPQEGLLDTGIVIGEVFEVKKDPSNPVLWDITVRPVYKVSELTQVAVIDMIPAEDE
jgi:cell shape-determining protein MreC